MEDFHSQAIPDLEPQPSVGKPGGFRRFILDVFETLLLALALFFVINAISARIRIESISMQPTLYAGNFVIVNKIAYLLNSPGRGDIIVFKYPLDPNGEPYIKRIIGLPGDSVRITGGTVYVNEQPMNEPYISAPPKDEAKWTVPPDSLFVMGDNRPNSSDSRKWGMVPFKNIIGKAEVVYWPPSRWQLLNQATAAAAQP